MPETDPSLQVWLDHWRILDQPRPHFGFKALQAVVNQQGWNRLPARVVMVAGTNGKGSCVAALHALCRAAQLNVMSFTSPHFLSITERFKFNEALIHPQVLFQAIQVAESLQTLEHPWSFFECLTLAFFHWVCQHSPDVVLLEVGLGGRLDAVNTTAHEGAVITSIDYDHTEILGRSLAEIAAEKSGIIRSKTPCIWGMDSPIPAVILEQANTHQALCVSAKIEDQLVGHLPASSLHAAQLTWKTCFKDQTLSDDQVRTVLTEVRLSGRFERVIWQGREWILDVAHNPAACLALCQKLHQRYGRRVHLMCAWLKDKDVRGCIQALMPVVRHWYCVPLTSPRAILIEALREKLLSVSVATQAISLLNTRKPMVQQMMCKIDIREPVVVCGSFFLLTMVKKEQAETQSLS